MGLNNKEVYRLLALRLKYERYFDRVKKFVFKRSFKYLFVNVFDRAIFVAEHESEKKVVGIAIVSNVVDELWNLNIIAVSPNFRGLRIGTLLMKDIVSYVKNKGGIRIHVAVTPDNTSAVKLYTKFGFVSTGPVDHMKLDL